MKLFTRTLTLILALTVALCLAACSGQSDKDGAAGTTTAKTGEALEVKVELDMTNAYLEYAKRLEKSGNGAAAATVYSMLEKATAADAKNAAKRTAEENKVYQAVKQLMDAKKELAFWEEVSGK